MCKKKNKKGVRDIFVVILFKKGFISVIDINGRSNGRSICSSEYFFSLPFASQRSVAAMLLPKIYLM